MKVTIYHNPRCSKSRQALDLLHKRHIDPIIVEYLKNPPDKKELDALLVRLAMEPRELMRTKEAAYLELGLDDPRLSRDRLITAMIEHPVLIERPIVIAGDRAVVGRPPEKILDIL